MPRRPLGRGGVRGRVGLEPDKGGAQQGVLLQPPLAEAASEPEGVVEDLGSASERPRAEEGEPKVDE